MSDIEQHEYNLITGYCIHCGLSIVHECDPPYQCHRHKNVTAISHLVRILNVLRTPFTNHNSNSD